MKPRSIDPRLTALALDEMSRFGFCQRQAVHPIFVKLAKLRNTQPRGERHSAKLYREIEAIEREIEQSMNDAKRDYQRFMASNG